MFQAENHACWAVICGQISSFWVGHPSIWDMGPTAEDSSSFNLLVLIHWHKSISAPRHDRGSLFPFCMSASGIKALPMFSKALYTNSPNSDLKKKKKSAGIFLWVLSNYIYIFAFFFSISAQNMSTKHNFHIDKILTLALYFQDLCLN